MKKIFAALLLSAVVGNASAQVVISQIYGGGGNSGSVYKNDFIEILNIGTTSISLNGFSVQYASATGTTWAVTALSDLTLQPNEYYLIQEAAGTGGTTNLPTPDATGTIAMSGTAGKVALSSSITAFTGATPTGANLLDFVGFGTATTFEGTGPAPAPSNSNSIFRLNGGFTDTNNNAADFVTGLAGPRNSTTFAAVPEPSTYGLVIAGMLVALAVVRRRRANLGA